MKIRVPKRKVPVNDLILYKWNIRLDSKFKKKNYLKLSHDKHNSHE